MLDFIIKYWLEALFTLITVALGFFARHYYNLWRESQESQKEKMREDIIKQMQDETQKKFDNYEKKIEQLLHVVLEVQGKQFRADCQELLDCQDQITYAVYNNLHNEYEMYKSLGGNGLGEELFGLVQSKYEGQLMLKDQVGILTERLGVHPCNQQTCHYYMKVISDYNKARATAEQELEKEKQEKKEKENK